ncbi:hypothetical protein [Cellulomonas dongxiuzhuiae]|uniref:Uncharacterized protein n=1 Tax=Cellulomonas dongxiuzhuiae TaxID=2819979 RepID=A0ABX8GGM1_9CELL|nr:hypothetical protein [Cellulomonas dongxiuzhuiae]MBO3088688.1 hypothetical protein [Cellulomonas dongxiuzhuiae]MBO3093977.1 hypothetical protein [Cellulomonas dongxiuzhuiae]QWC15055.1 hypothetical protein KKR89_12015 [Cellulomonas dongxiuzhuiae]
MLRSTHHARHAAVPATRHERLHAARGRRARRRVTTALAVAAVVATTLPSAATARDAGAARSAATSTDRSVAAPPAADLDAVTTPGTEDAEIWCDYLSSYYLAFPSPWTARVINCRSTSLLVAPVRSDGSLGTCVLVPARHSRHLGGNVVRWVTDTRLC